MPPEGASIETLRARAALVARTREFFAAREVLEVETLLIGHGLVVEAHLEPIPCAVRGAGADSLPRHLLTSPEGPMKRLLARGSGPIYQLAPAFRDGERGARHTPEFTILEWYRPGFDHHALMAEVEALVRALMPERTPEAFERRTYRDLFRDAAGIDPFDTSVAAIAAACARLGVPLPPDFAASTLDDALDLLLVGALEPTLGRERPLFLVDYPASQAALARVREEPDGTRVGERFELYIDGVELANGYHELGDPAEQRRRLEEANAARVASGRPPLPIAESLVAALEAGLPPCAGVALGFDRLVMVATGHDTIDAVRAFPPE